MAKFVPLIDKFRAKLQNKIYRVKMDITAKV